MKKISLIIILFCLLVGCSGKPNESTIKDAYIQYWKANFGDNMTLLSNFRVVDGFQSNDKTYIADVEYDHKLKNSIPADHHQYHVIIKATLIKKDSGWVVSYRELVSESKIENEEDTLALAERVKTQKAEEEKRLQDIEKKQLSANWPDKYPMLFSIGNGYILFIKLGTVYGTNRDVIAEIRDKSVYKAISDASRSTVIGGKYDGSKQMDQNAVKIEIIKMMNTHLARGQVKDIDIVNMEIAEFK